MTAASSASGGLGAALRQGAGGVSIERFGFGDRLVQRREALAADVEIGETRRKLRRDRRQILDHDLVFPRRGSERKEPLLGALQLGRVELAAVDRRLQAAARFVEMIDGGVQGLDGAFQQARQLGRFPLQPTRQPDQARHRRGSAADDLVRLIKVAGNLCRAHQELPALGQRRLLARLGRQLLQLLDGGAQIIGFALGRGELGAQLLTPVPGVP